MISFDVLQISKTPAFSFLIFVFFGFVGAFSAANDTDFVRIILGDTYVNNTLANIEKGDPMAVYKEAHQTDMFLGITINNIRVSLTAFTFGALFGLGTLFLAMQNAIMLGSFSISFMKKACYGNQHERFGYMAQLRFR